MCCMLCGILPCSLVRAPAVHKNSHLHNMFVHTKIFVRNTAEIIRIRDVRACACSRLYMIRVCIPIMHSERFLCEHCNSTDKPIIIRRRIGGSAWLVRFVVPSSTTCHPLRPPSALSKRQYPNNDGHLCICALRRPPSPLSPPPPPVHAPTHTRTHILIYNALITMGDVLGLRSRTHVR